MTFIKYTHDGKAVIQPAALTLSNLDNEDTLEMHTLDKIAETPGMRVSDIARLWSRTLGAASRNVDRLQGKGLVDRVKLPDNQKNVRVYPTEKGRELSRLHRAYDRRELDELAETMLQVYSVEELATFYRVLHSLREVFEQKL